MGSFHMFEDCPEVGDMRIRNDLNRQPGTESLEHATALVQIAAILGIQGRDDHPSARHNGQQSFFCEFADRLTDR